MIKPNYITTFKYRDKPIPMIPENFPKYSDDGCYIYFIFSDDDLWYVGRSSYIKQRLDTHLRDRFADVEDVYFSLLEVPFHLLRDAERYFILKEQPRFQLFHLECVIDTYLATDFKNMNFLEIGWARDKSWREALRCSLVQREADDNQPTTGDIK